MNENDASGEFERTRDMSQLDQTLAVHADIFPPAWRRMYLGCVESGFTASEALELVKTWILSVGRE